MSAAPVLPAPFPAFGGKAKATPLVWDRFGNVDTYTEPCCYSAAILFGRPAAHLATRRIETINDIHAFIPNFWRALQADPDAVARWIDYPVSEVDLFARHVWLVRQTETLRARLEADPHWYDAQIAGWWCWGACAWIGSGWCSGDGPHWIDEDGAPVVRDAGRGVNRKLPHLGDAGRGVNRQLPHLGDAGRGVNRQLPHLGNAGRGVNRKLPHLGDAGQGEYLRALAARLRHVRVTCGDWSRVVTPAVLHASRNGVAGVFLDPPYGEGAVDYSSGGNSDSAVADAVRAWAVANGDNPRLRIALCRYADGTPAPEGWKVVRWRSRGGYHNQSAVGQVNRHREEIWFSPHCLTPQLTLWSDL